MRTLTLLEMFIGLATIACGSSVDSAPQAPFASFDEVLSDSMVESYSFFEPSVHCARFAEYPGVAQLIFGHRTASDAPQLFILLGEIASGATTYSASNVRAAMEHDIGGPPLSCSGGPCASFSWSHDLVTAASHHELDRCALDARINDGVLHGTFQCASMLATANAELDILDGDFACELE